MIENRRSIGDFIDIRVISLTIFGKPSAVHSGAILFTLRDGGKSLLEFSFEPNGVMYEVFQEQINGLFEIAKQNRFKD